MTDRVQRRLAAIVSADVVGFTRLMQADEAGTHQRLKTRFQGMVQAKLDAYGGRLFKLMGDGLLAEFPSVVSAVEWSLDVQKVVAAEEDEPDDRRIEYRIGINLGDLIIDGDDLYGDGVNLAARLQGVAPVGGICMSDASYQYVRGKVDDDFTDGGEVELKNLDAPVRVWRWSPRDDREAVLERPSPKPVELALPEKPSIAVLPFDNMSTDEEQEHFADGISEDLITGLSRIRWLFVIARNSSFVYKRNAVDVRQVARELGVRYVLEGSVRKAGNRVRIAAQLIDAQTSNHLWAERYDRELIDIFDVQDEITERVAGAIEPAILAAEGLRARDRSRDDLGAWEMLAQGLATFWRFTKSDAAEAIAILDTAVQRYPQYAPAKSMLAFMLLFSAHVGWRDLASTRADAEALAYQAVALDEHDAWTHVVLGYLHTMNRNANEAHQAFTHAISLNPNFASGFGWRGFAESHAGNTEEAIADFEMAFRLSPKDPQNAIFLGGKALAHFLRDEFDTSAAIAGDVIRQRPEWNSTRRMECTALARAGRMDEAQASLARLLEHQPGLTAATLRKSLPYPNSEHLEKFVGGLVLAGLPEE